MTETPGGPGNTAPPDGDGGSWAARLAADAARELMSVPGDPIPDPLVIVVTTGGSDAAARVREAVDAVEKEGVAVVERPWPGAAQREIGAALRGRGIVGWLGVAIGATLEDSAELANTAQDWIDGKTPTGIEGPRKIRP
ncbi:MAG: hypothetical protein ACKOWF_17310 [Chloroflexota bacterium]